MKRSIVTDSPTAIEIARRAEPLAEPRRGASIEQMIRIAADLFAERGFDNVTMDEIAEAVSVPKRSLYRRFRYKDEFLVRWMLRINDQICAAIAKQPADVPPLTAILAALHQIEEFKGQTLQRLRVMHQITSGSLNAMSASLTTQLVWEEEMAQALAQRHQGKGCEAENGRLIAGIALVGLRCAFAEWTMLPGPKASRVALLQILDSVFSVIGPSSR